MNESLIVFQMEQKSDCFHLVPPSTPNHPLHVSRHLNELKGRCIIQKHGACRVGDEAQGKPTRGYMFAWLRVPAAAGTSNCVCATLIHIKYRVFLLHDVGGNWL